MFHKSSRSASHSGPSTTAVVVLLATLLILALMLPNVGRVGSDAQDQPLRPAAGLGL
jgi:hypothetical protein